MRACVRVLNDTIRRVAITTQTQIKREFALHGLPEDKQNLRKVAGGTWGDGKTLAHLAAHPHARIAKLERVHVLALRLYTTSSYARVNDPLRKEPPQRPHPFAATTCDHRCGVPQFVQMRHTHNIKGLTAWQRSAPNLDAYAFRRPPQC